jgi:hypothetical protein
VNFFLNTAVLSLLTFSMIFGAVFYSSLIILTCAVIIAALLVFGVVKHLTGAGRQMKAFRKLQGDIKWITVLRFSEESMEIKSP